MSEDYLTTDVTSNASRTGTMNVPEVARATNEGRKRENLTEMAKDALSRMGVKSFTLIRRSLLSK
ncbi:hypothetical protein DFS33DRAFT_28427 [Desarmillaria ectypa]|nr:hypothetical protein DFS33DRAFT_28427 [Desarmillaria ectypa]